MTRNEEIRREMSYGMGSPKRMEDMQFRIVEKAPDPEKIADALLEGVVLCCQEQKTIVWQPGAPVLHRPAHRIYTKADGTPVIAPDWL